MREPADQVRWLWCGVQHQSFRSIVFEPDEVQKNQAEAHTSCQRLCFRPSNKTITAQSLASKPCVGVTKRPMATGE